MRILDVFHEANRIRWWTGWEGGWPAGGEEENDSKVSDLSNGRTELPCLEKKKAVGGHTMGPNVKTFHSSTDGNVQTALPCNGS